MRLEIERKFLVKGDFKGESIQKSHIVQGYICRLPGRSVRVRIRDNKGYLTIKGASNTSGTTRIEWETEISEDDARTLFLLAEPGVIEKTRYLVHAADGKHIWEIDVFHGDNEGLIVAEIELSDENESFDTPAWLGEEVTGDPRYFNSMLMKNPYKDWQ